MTFTNRSKHGLSILISIVLFVAVGLLCVACATTEEGRLVAIHDANGVEIETSLSIEMQPQYQFRAVVSGGGGDGEIEFASSDLSVAEIDNNGLAVIKKPGTTQITAKITGTEISKNISFEVKDVDLADSEFYMAAVDANRDVSLELQTSEEYAGLYFCLSVNDQRSGYYSLDERGNAVIPLQTIGMEQTGIYKIGVQFFNGNAVKIEALGISDVVERFYFENNEGWRVSSGSTTPSFQNGTLTVTDGWGAVAKDIQLNNLNKHYIRVYVEEGNAQWGIKLNSSSVYDTSDDLNLIDDRWVVPGEVIVADAASFAGRMQDADLQKEGDYTVQMKVFASASGGEGSVSISCIEIFGDDGAIREAVPINNYTESGQFEVDIHNANLRVGRNYEIKVRAEESSFGYHFSSSDPSVASVSSEGVVTGIREGSAVIRVASYDGTYSDEVKVTVYVPVDSIQTLREEYVVSASLETFDLQEQITVLPDTATYKGLSYEIISGGDIATIDEEGMLSWNSAGEVTVRVTSADPFQVSVDVLIVIDDAYVSVERMDLGESATITAQVDQEFLVTPKFYPETASDQSYTVEILTPGITYSKGMEGASCRFVAWGNGTGTIRFRSVANPAVYVDCKVTVYQDYVYAHDANSLRDWFYIKFSTVPDENLSSEQHLKSSDTVKLDFLNPEDNSVLATFSQTMGAEMQALISKDKINNLVDGTSYKMRVRVYRGDTELYGYWISSIEEYQASMDMIHSNWGGNDNALFYPTDGNSLTVAYDGGSAIFYTMFEYDSSLGGFLTVRTELSNGGTYAFKMGTDPEVDTITFIPDGNAQGLMIFNLSEWKAESGNYYLRFYLAQNGTTLTLSDLIWYHNSHALQKVSF